MGRLDTDPQGLLDALDKGEFDGLDPIYREGLKTSARGEIARRDAAAQVAADKAAKERQTAIGDELKEIIAISKAGRRAAQSGILADPEVQKHPLYREAVAATQLGNERPTIGTATVAQLDAMIAEEKAKPVVRDYQTERLKVLEAQRDRTAEALGKDPVRWATDSAVAAPPLDLAGSEPGQLAKSLRARAIWGDAMEKSGYGRTVGATPFSAEEQAEIKRRTGVDQDPAARAALAREMAAGLGARGAATLSGDPVFGHVAGLLGAGAPPALAEEVFRGEQAISSKTVELPPAKDRLEAAFDTVGDLFAGLPGGEAVQAQVTAAADALYAARMKGVDPTGKIDTDAWTQALNDVLGGAGSGRDRTGGIQDIRDLPTALPPGVRAADVETALDRLGSEPGRDLTPEELANPEMLATRTADDMRTDPAILQRQLAAISVDGRVPTVGGEPLRREDLPNLTLRAVGGNDYAVVYRRLFGSQVVVGEDGRDWRLSLPKLLKETAR